MKLAKSSVDLYEIFETLDMAKQYDGYVVARCPFHSDMRPSFFVYPDWYRCVSCGANGPTDTLLRKLGKVERSLSPHKEQISSDNPFTAWMRYRTLRQVLKTAWETINNNPGLGKYIVEDRGIDEFYRHKLGIGYMDDWYTIPIRNRNGIIISAVARRGRDNKSQSKYVLPNGTDPNILYIPNRKRVRDANYLLVTFGILDAITLAIIGEPAASTITGKKLNKASFTRFRIPILLIPDRREEQDGLSEARKLGWRGKSKTLHYPEGCNDINDIWVKDRQLCTNIVKEITHGLD